MSPHAGYCDSSPSASLTRITVHSDISVAWVVIHEDPYPGPYVFVIDNVSVDSPSLGTIPAEPVSWSALKSSFKR
jgi:hypothetical protein